MKIYTYDTEFYENGSTIELVSIGIVAEDGRTYYAVDADLPVDSLKSDPWLCQNVWAHLPIVSSDGKLISRDVDSLATAKLDMTSALVKPKWVIANEVREFLLHNAVFEGSLISNQPELWAYYGSYDHVVLAQLWGRMINLPKGIPMWTREIMELVDNPDRGWVTPSNNQEHHALADARWNMAVLRAADIVA